MVDGSVQFLKETLDVTVYGALTTRAGEEVVGNVDRMGDHFDGVQARSRASLSCGSLMRVGRQCTLWSADKWLAG
jgi:hypothetical protein